MTSSLTGDLTVGKEVGGDTVIGDLTEGNGGGEAMRSASCGKEKKFVICQNNQYLNVTLAKRRMTKIKPVELNGLPNKHYITLDK